MLSTTQRLFFGVLLALACERLYELAVSRRHLKSSSAFERAGEDSLFPVMASLNVALIALPALEVWLLRPVVPIWLFALCAAVLALAQVLRWSAVATLGRSWNVRAVVTPELGFTARGPYRFVRHPNYVAVILEFLALPAAGGAWISLALLNLLHAPVLAHRIRVEEEMLFAIPGYREVMGSKNRLVPRLFGR